MAVVRLHAIFGKLFTSSLPILRPQNNKTVNPCNQLILVRHIARRLRRKIGNPKPRTPTSTVKDSATNNASNVNFATDKEIASISDKLSLENLAKYQLQRSTALIAPNSVYQKRANIQKTVIGEWPAPRYVWLEKEWPNGFPDSAEEAGTDVATYLEQRDIYQRLKMIHIPKFCVGSIVAVTRAEPYAPKGSLRFVGICIQKKHPQNILKASFILRNVIDNEPIEINFELYSPMIQKIEVLKHEKRTDKQGKEDLRFLRDFPINDSKVDENMEALPYTEEPTLYKPRPLDTVRLKRWFKQKFKEKSPRRYSS